MNPEYFVDLILPVPLRQLFTYRVPDSLIHECEVGKRAVVQFGKKKIYSALIKKVHQNKPQAFQAKEIINIIDSEPIVNKEQFSFWEWMAEYYMCSEGEIYKAALPAGLRLESNTSIVYNHKFFENEDAEAKWNFTPKETTILDALQADKSLTLNDINDILSVKSSLTHIKNLYDKGAIKIHETLEKGFRAKTEKYILLNQNVATNEQLNEVFEKLKRAQKQTEVLNNFLTLSNFEVGASLVEVSQKALLRKSGGSAVVINQLVKKGILELVIKDISRLEFKASPGHAYRNNLNQNQQKAFGQIQLLFKERETVLLHGVTSSGKTEIYIRLIDEYIQKGKQVLYLLPEIALTSQIVERLRNVFGERTGVYHSKYNDAERVETWNNIIASDNDEGKQYQLILGVRSSIFLPFNNLGLIIIDEEHENTYKQFKPAPRYQARDSAIVLAKIHRAKTLLGTATPSVESYFNAKSGKYGLVTLNQRHLNIALPEIMIADIKEARRKKQMKSHFTPVLLENIQLALDQKEQVILFQNRRGFAPYIECHDCGWIPRCEHCDVSLTYHRHTSQLVCHYCGFSYTNLQTCAKCKSSEIRTRGFGTEKVEEELKIFFPDTIIKRLDLDTSKGKKSHSRIISDFENHRIDILVGTQMISKGLDFENVSLVGILDANQMLNFPDFRAYERSYQLMAQVGGRAGRKNKQGKVIIQTTSPDNPIVQYVQQNDYENMFKSQVFERKQFKYPPFNRLISITLKHKNKEALDKAACHYANWLKKAMKDHVIGPEYPIVSKIHDLYLKTILIKIEKPTLATAYKKYIIETSEHLLKQNAGKSIQIVYDVDPY